MDLPFKNTETSYFLLIKQKQILKQFALLS